LNPGQLCLLSIRTGYSVGATGELLVTMYIYADGLTDSSN
jgi:hypothetical protein